MGIIKSFLNAFRDVDKTETNTYAPSVSYGVRPDRIRTQSYNNRSIITSIYTRLAIDVSDITIRHVLVDTDDRFKDIADSKLNDALLFSPSLDQGPRQFRQDIARIMFDKSVAAIVPVDMTTDPMTGELTDVYSIRVGVVTAWYPKHVKVDLYNEEKGIHQEIIIEKRLVALVENPFLEVMNLPNSTLQRLIRKLTLLDQVDEVSASGKLDLIIQLPYTIKSEARKKQAEDRRDQIEMQLKGSTYGIAYTDGTEKITQLNRPAENNLMAQVEYLTNMLYGQLGLTEEVMNGTADEKTMLNYFNRTIEPIVTAIVEAMQKSFIGQTRYESGERIRLFRDPFKFVPVASLAEIADKFTRNEIMTANEIRGSMGIPPSSDPKADELRNSNMPQSKLETSES